jgi:hypothetical protein
VGGWDEEDERQLMMLQLEAAAIKALDSRPTLKQEQQLLQHAVKQQQSSGSQQGSSSSFRDAARQDQQQQRQLQQQMFDKLAGIAGQLSLTGDRQAIRQQVGMEAQLPGSGTAEFDASAKVLLCLLALHDDVG